MAVAALYDAGFSAIVSAAPSDSTFEPLRRLARLKEQIIGWAVLDEASYVAMRSSNAMAWLAVVPEGHAILDSMYTVLQINASADIPVVHVKPDLIAPVWAGIFLTYSVSYLCDVALGVLTLESTEEARDDASKKAYYLEYLAMLAAGGEAFARELDFVIADLQPTSLRDSAKLFPSVLPTYYVGLDSLLGRTATLSEGEGERRGGALAAALVIRHAILIGSSDAEVRDAIRCLTTCPP